MGTDIHGRVQMRYSPEGKYVDTGPIEDDRNYRVFAMLAGVRNGFGFAGVKTHEPLVPISEPRGLPADLGDSLVDGDSVKVDPYADDEPEWLGDHSHSWLTLKEITDWPGWDKPLHMVGYLTPEEAARCDRENDSPRTWCGGTTDSTYVRREWTVPFRDYAKVFRAWLDYQVLKHGWLIESDPDAVRIVFGFDS